MASSDWMQQAANAAAERAPTVTVAPDVVPGRVISVDGDMICYWAGGKDDTSVAVSRLTALRKIENMREMSGAESTVVHTTADSSTKGDRRIIATVKPYQGQRKGDRKPKNWQYLRDLLADYHGPEFRPKVWATREADDGIAYLSHVKPVSDGNVPNHVIATKDKDMRMLPGIHLDWNTLEMVHVPKGCFEMYNADRSKLFGHKWFWMQMLHGDTADNVPGLPLLDGKPVGPARAAKILADVHDNANAMDRVTDCYQFEYGTVEEWIDRFLEQGLLLWMRCDASASIRDLQNFLIDLPWQDNAQEALVEGFDRVEQRIKEAYAEAQKLGSCGVQEDRA